MAGARITEVENPKELKVVMKWKNPRNVVCQYLVLFRVARIGREDLPLCANPGII